MNPPSPSSFSSRLAALLGRHLRCPRLSALESTSAPKRHGGRIFPGVGIERRRFARRFIDELASERVYVTWPA
jgi:hypothetical protein